ncbi:MAG: efflux transporter outer membrane subunit [Desulfuromonadales bacterium]|nr:efflux transporter outer membrane subunit [Desulfuromonadales bacterium]
MRNPVTTLSTIMPKELLLVLSMAFTLGGCAPFPSLSQLSPLKTISDHQTVLSFSAPVNNWPCEQWWQTYGDPQLDRITEEALRDSPDMAAAHARLLYADAVSQTTRAALFPQVSANASISEQTQSYNYLMPRDATPKGWQDYGLATLGVNWEIDFWGKNRAGLAAATSQLEASRAEIAQARLSLAAAIATNYAELARLFSTHDTVARSVEVRGKTVALFNERYINGLETRGSLSEATARLAEVEGELLLVDEQIGLQRQRLATLMGAGPDRGLAINRPAYNLKKQYGLPSELAVNLLGRRPDVVAARLQAEAQLSRIDQKKAEFYPNVNLSAFIGVQSLGLNMLLKSASGIGGVGPAITLPIFTGGRLRCELRGTVANYEEAVANYNRTVTWALQDVANTLLSQKALRGQLAKAEQAVSAAGEAHRVARDRYDGGLATYIEVLFAEDILLNTQRNLTTLHAKAFLLDIALTRALGGGYQANKS